MISKPILLITFFFHTDKCLDLFLSNTNNSILYLLFVITQLNGSKYCYISLTWIVYTQLNDQTILFQAIQFNINHLFALSLNVKEIYLTHR